MNKILRFTDALIIIIRRRMIRKKEEEKKRVPILVSTVTGAEDPVPYSKYLFDHWLQMILFSSICLVIIIDTIFRTFIADRYSGVCVCNMIKHCYLFVCLLGVCKAFQMFVFGFWMGMYASLPFNAFHQWTTFHLNADTVFHQGLAHVPAILLLII